MFKRVAGHKRSLTFFVEFALTNYQEPEEQKKLTDAVREYLAAKEHEPEQDTARA